MTQRPHPWQAYNLRGSPYFQDNLSRNTRNTSLSLFVGRQRELQKLLIRIEGSLTGSRQAVAGRPGIGKTTLVEAVKADARDAGYWVAPQSIALTPEASSLDLSGQVLSGVYGAVTAACDNPSAPEVEAAQQLITSFRLHGGGLAVGAFGFSGGGSRSEGVSQPPSALLLDGPRVLRNLLGYALAQGARGVLLHLNNLENISTDHAQKAADKLRAVRDQALMLEGLHVIVVGTTDAVCTAVLHHDQVRSVFSEPLVLDPLSLAEVEHLLRKRYKALQLDDSGPQPAPVDAAVIQELHGLFRGDLRAMLRALEDGVVELLIADQQQTNASGGRPPISRDALLKVLHRLYQELLKQQLGSTTWKRLEAWAAKDAAVSQTRKQLQKIWKLSQPAVSRILQDPGIAVAVEALPRHGKDPIQYLLTGAARLALLDPAEGQVNSSNP
ncbi:hypothetical protein BV61_01170 [Candidatus Synechococcus spongiarum LMB bulk15M]|uniref:Orc1-like AAA ATPase domain-containing protein n=2 Tax=Candidatus Synechococcus spongiarum TaxID=431041 RepID=A0A1T1D2W2_9SYNE|nr:hypothetical protein BV61_01170 [Candidatus Synechococcus spongiarum LMB bulk15M]